MLSDFDFAAHNAEVAALWDAYGEGRPWRVPVIVGTSTRYFIFSRDANPDGVSFREYVEDPLTMMRCQMQFANWSRHNILQDVELGPPTEGWDVRVDFQNYYEAAWLGCPVEYFDGQVPDTRPILSDDESKRRSFDTGFPIDFAATRRALGPDVQIQGGPHVELLRQGPPEAIVAEVRRILGSGVAEGRRFILREGNNLAPHTPVAHLKAMYDAGREYGRYR